MAKTGRPSIFTPELETLICDRVAAGESILKICNEEGFPEESVLWRYVQRSESFASAIARAMETRSDGDIERCRKEAEAATPETWQVAQLRIRTLQWEAGKRRPKKYGERMNVDAQVDVSLADTVREMRQRLESKDE